MKTLLDYLCHDHDVRMGEWTLMCDGGPTISAIHDRSLSSPLFKANLAGLRKLLAYIDSNPHGQ